MLGMKQNRGMPVLVGLLLVIILALGWVGYAAVQRVAGVTEDLYDHPFTVSTAVLRIRANVIGLDLLMKNVILAASPDEISQYGKTIDQTEMEIMNDFIVVQDQFLGAPSDVQEAMQSFSRLRPILDEVVKLSLAGKRQDASVLAQTSGAQGLQDIKARIDTIRNFARAKAQAFRVDARDTRDKTFWLVLFSLSAGLVLAGAVSRMAVRLEKKLHDQNEQLDSKVRERTRELSIVNGSLAAQNEEITAMNEELKAQNEEITAMVEELTAQNEEIAAQNEEIALLNQNLEAMNDTLERRVDERTADLAAAHQQLLAQYDELSQSQGSERRSARIKDVLREIVEASVTAPSLVELYQSVHQLVGKVLPVKNFYFNLFEESSGDLVKPYCVDETNTMPMRRPYGRGLTEYAMRQRKVVYLTPLEFMRLQECGEIESTLITFSEWAGAPLVNYAGKPFGVVALFLVDETESPLRAEDLEVLTVVAAQLSAAIERKRAEEQLVNRESRLLRAQTVAHIGDWVLDLASRQVRGSSEAFNIYGIEQNVPWLSLETIQQFVCNEDRPKLDMALKSLVDHNTKYDLEFRIKRRDTGDQRIVHSIAELEYDSDGNPARVIGVIQDITERKQAENALAESEARYRAVIEQASEAVLICDPDTGDVIEANLCFAQRFGYDLSKEGELNLHHLISDGSQIINSFLEDGRQEPGLPMQRSRLKHRNGSLVAVERSCTLVNYQGRKLFVMTILDVSDEVRREQEIQRDARMATRIQNALLSVPEPSDFLTINTIFQPYGYVGGDLYFLDWRYGGRLLRGFLVDATGHGLGTSLHTASVHVLLREVNERDLPLSTAMRWLNRRAGKYFDEWTFAGALGFELDLETRQLRWTCAGIPKIWIATQTQQGAVACPGMMLGISQEETFDTNEIPIDVNDSIYFVTDGLSDLMERQAGMPLDCYPRMVEMLRNLSNSDARRDDATAICINVRSLPISAVRQDGWPRILRFNGYGDYQRLKSEVSKIVEEVTGKPHSIHEVAINEALANAMECRDGIQRQHKARIRFNKVGNRFIVRVKTSRMGFAGNAILRRLRSHPEEMFSFGEDAAMGRGIPMMLSMSHRMTYNSEGTEVLLSWKL